MTEPADNRKDKGPDTTEWSAEPSAAALNGEEEGSPRRVQAGQYPMIVRSAPPEHFAWLTERSGYVPMPDARGIEVVEGGEIRGMVVFDGFTSTIAQIHVATDSPEAGAALLRPTFEYPFRQIGLLALVSMVPASKSAAVATALRQGFSEVCRIKDGVDVGTDLILFEMRREACRVLTEVH